MMDPTSAVDQSVAALEHRLLDAARQDRVPDMLSARMAAGLGVLATSLAAQSAQAAPAGSKALAGSSKASSTSWLVKAGLWGSLSVGLAAVGFQALPRAERSHEVPRAAQAAPASVPVVAPSVASPARAVEPQPEAEAPTNTKLVAPSLPLAASTESDPRVSALPIDAALRAEIALLDRARTALREQEGSRALRLLDQHESRFLRPSLAPEADVLRIEALSQRGHRTQAEALSQRFLASYPSHPLREHVASLLARAKTH